MTKKTIPNLLGSTRMPLKQTISKGQPGFMRKPAPGVPPARARKLFAHKQVHAKSLSEFQQKQNGTVRAFGAAAGQASNTVATPVMTTAELARALKQDPDLIFYHVYNNIEFHPTFGLQKGSRGVMIDGIGNAFDQCQLLVDLLTESGYTASFLYGELSLTQNEVSSWLGTDSSSIWNSYYLLANGGIPCEAVWNGSEYHMELSHVWVKVTIDSVDYVLDPSFKTYSTTTGIDLATAMSYSRSAFLDDADDGATLTADYAQNVNASNISANLAAYSDNLIDYINGTNPTATMDEVLGGRAIIKVETPVRQTSHPKQKEGPTNWASIPNSYRITVRFQYDSIDETLYGDELHGRRVTFFFNGSRQGELRVDGTLIDSTSAKSLDFTANMGITVTHPYPVTWFDQFNSYTLNGPTSGGTHEFYLIGTSFGVINDNLVDYHNHQYVRNKFAGGGAQSEPILGERLAVRWHTYLGQLHVVADILGRMTNNIHQGHHHIGLCYVQDFASRDLAAFNIQGAMGASSSLEGDAAKRTKFATALSMHAYCLEMLATQQVTGNNAISTTRVLEVANNNGDKIYKATNSNWSTIQSSLTGYGGSDISNIDFYTGIDWFVLVPEVAPITIEALNCTAYAALSPDGGGTGILNSNFGGVGDDGDEEPPCENCPAPYTYTYSFPGINMGGGGGTDYDLTFETEYSSGFRFQDGVLGLGWTHNFDIHANTYSGGFGSLGGAALSTTAVTTGAGVSIAELFVTLDLLSDTDYPVLNLIAASLCTSWWANELTNNVVVVSASGSMGQFTRRADGSYNPPTGDTSVLVKNIDGSFTLTNKHQIVKQFNTNGQLTSVEFPCGVTMTLAYASGKLSTVSNGMGRTLTFTYTGDKLTSVSDGNGRSIAFSYDGNSQLVAITDPLGEDTTFSYVTAEFGLLESYFMPENPTDPMVTNIYDSGDRVESQLDMNGEPTYFYFAGWRSEIENTLGQSIVMEFDRNGNVIKSTDELGNVTTSTYDGLNRLVQTTAPEGNSENFTYDAKNNVLTRTLSPKPGSSLEDIVETCTYDPTYNLPTTYEDGRGNTTTYSYDSMTGNLLTIERPEVDSQTPTITMTYNGRGQVLSREDETGIVTEYEYDTTTEVLQQVTVDSGVGRLNLTTTFGYNAWGDLISVTDPRGNEFTRTCDFKRRVTQMSAASPFNFITNITYDKNDNRLTIERETGDVEHPWQIFEATYNIANQVVTVKDPLNNQITNQYDQLRRLWKVTDPEGRITERQYDERGMLKKIINPDSAEGQVNTYTGNGQVETVEDANGNITHNIYDGFDRLEKTVFPDDTFEQVTEYDENGSATGVLDRAGNTSTRTFDVLNRLIEKSTFGMPSQAFAYDLAGRLTSLGTDPVTGDPSSGEWLFGYDSAGRLESEEAPDGKTVSYELDENGNITKITYPDSYYVDRLYDELNRLTDIKLNGSEDSSAQFAYDYLSRRTSLTLGSPGNEVTTNYSFERNDNLNSIEHAFTGSNLDFGYGFNAASELIGQSVSDSRNVWTPSISGTTTYGAANNLNQYPTVGGTSYAYNDNGCLTSDGVWSFAYDSENHLTSATKAGVSATYIYDPQHRQIQKDVDGNKTRFVYAGWRRIADYDGSDDTLQNRYVYGEGLDEPLIKVSDTDVLTFMHANHIGSIVAITDEAGAVTSRFKYSPWGESEDLSGTTFGYTGQRYDEETGLYYFKNRYYSPSLGRFLQTDPIGGLNLYSYAFNSPLVHTDSLGLAPDLPDGYEQFVLRTLHQLYNRSWRYHNKGEIGTLVQPGGSNFFGPYKPKVSMYSENDKNAVRPYGRYSLTTTYWLNDYSDLLMTHIHPEKIAKHVGMDSGFAKNDYDPVTRTWTINFDHNAFMWDPKQPGYEWYWKWDHKTKLWASPVQIKKRKAVPYVDPGATSFGAGHGTVVVVPECSCKSKKVVTPTLARTPRPAIDVDPNKGITNYAGIEVPPGLDVRGYIGMQAIALAGKW